MCVHVCVYLFLNACVCVCMCEFVCIFVYVDAPNLSYNVYQFVLYQGRTCEEDVNECAVYMGTDLGCQNGATCINTRGGYR